ncbi:alpha-2-antiplasmin [Cygnus atratus]|uniref:alpha-2-antiplasmin n=1 Tax=Cygnus atratus TaxID=8868 RepID=UPI0015D650CF|nr:alpha-2-antiplasmin [Cygnus atratus]XP_035428042.1 alpha-2-antiplasmin [Cygnus atratus]XP_050570709.1 alpha-2-antiplasmin [Cygnus atratus]
MVLHWGLLLLCLSALHTQLRLPLAQAIEQQHLSLDEVVNLKDLKGDGEVLAALPGAVPTLPDAKLSDTREETYGTTLPFPTTPEGIENDESPEDTARAGAGNCHGKELAGEVLSSEEEGEDEDNQSCDITWKKSQRLANGLMKFSINLLREVQQESDRSNVILSPLSIALALSHLALGAANQTEKHLLEVMHLESVPCLHHMLSTLRRRLAEATLSLASRVYLQKGFEVKEKFLEDSEKFYGAKPVSLSGSSEDDVEAINKWVKEATNGQIPTFLQQLPENTVMLLLNAIHFHGFWRNKFDAAFTSPDVFHLNDDFVVSVEMMKAQRYSLSWFTLESHDVQVAKFPFKGNVSFVVIVPNQYSWNTSHVLENFPYGQLCRLFPKEVPTTVKIPKMKLDYQLELNNVLSQMGLQELFTSPDLQKISDESLFVSSIQHQSSLELKEDGVEGSAATSVVISRSLSAFSLDRPFLFIIFEEEMGIPLFIGSVQNPNPNAAPQLKEPRHLPDARDDKEYPMPK